MAGEGRRTTSFFVGTLDFSPGECLYTRVYNETAEGSDGQFEEILLWDPDTNSTVFTSLIEDNIIGFDNTPKDFEMIVLENGHRRRHSHNILFLLHRDTVNRFLFFIKKEKVDS